MTTERARSRQMPSAASRLALGLVVLVAAGGCSSKSAFQSGIGRTGDLMVTNAIERGDYLDVTIAGDGVAMRVFAPTGGGCQALLAPESLVQYSSRGPGGRFTRGEDQCDATGIGDPFVNRMRQPRGQSARSSPVPRAQANFRKIFEDDEVILLRGQFPLTFHVGWAGGADTVAVVRNDEMCQGPASRGVASIEFRPAGRNTLSLVGSGGLCRIDGLIIP